MMQIMDFSKNNLKDSNTTILGVPEVIEPTVNDISDMEDVNQIEQPQLNLNLDINTVPKSMR